MPNLKTHKLVGAVAGAGWAAYQAWDQPGCLIEMIGGGFGGYLGGIMPDKLEPALSSWHRDVCHSWAAGGVTFPVGRVLSDLARACRKEADKYRAVQTLRDPVTGAFVPVPITFAQQLAELFWRLLAGFLNGLSAGYLSHLALDAGTPRGIPLLGRL